MGKSTIFGARKGRVQALFAPSDSGLQQTAKSVLAGGVATVVDYAVMLSLFSMAHAGRTVAVAGGYSVGLVICYIASIIWIFPHRKLEDKRLEFVIFAVIGLIGMVLTQLIVALGLKFVQGAMPHLSTAMQLCVAKFAAILLVFFFNFGARRYVLFDRRPIRAPR